MSATTPHVPAGGLAASVPLVLDASDIRVSFPRPGKAASTVIDGIGLGLERGQVTVLLGESGSGKTVFARAITGLAPASATVTGTALFDGVDLVTGSRAALRALHGRRIGVVPQDPNAALDPMRRIGSQMIETLRQHRQVSSTAEAKRRAVELLEQVQIRDPHRVIRCYPHEVSGGMRQRIAIAIAISCGPELIVADEPSSALDASVGAHVVALLDGLRERLHTAILFITHDIGIAARIASQPHDRVAVMLGGQIVELGFAPSVLAAPRHAYTRALLAAEPSVEVPRGQLAVVPESVRSRREWGPLVDVAPGHAVTAESELLS
ncbi:MULTISPECIES: ABC transporter ATP-binding protein [Microbacterium]|uniref:ABC transporter ATP-binding protein n=1 Tax=Microbacterium TaxID=33882 RepID=UPI00277FCCBE|nr:MULTISPECIES: ABC transporter ATP-binding protein [Microbacterium]MDQ1083713.1 ABC-type dipeptide/oligopeptide/nickel transport system ATPase component [Microbacterium sp. SORGH_AS_0344]MDQ1171010.1 ABC-type dipeptide/oligopeptide/nickel transport system ATPase component [Microbacterium proteolyticum]